MWNRKLFSFTRNMSASILGNMKTFKWQSGAAMEVVQCEWVWVFEVNKSMATAFKIKGYVQQKPTIHTSRPYTLHCRILTYKNQASNFFQNSYDSNSRTSTISSYSSKRTHGVNTLTLGSAQFQLELRKKLHLTGLKRPRLVQRNI